MRKIESRFSGTFLFSVTLSLPTINKIMKNTAFTNKHIALGAKMADFAGYNMPISYT